MTHDMDMGRANHHQFMDDKVSALPASVTSRRVGQLIDISIIFLWVST
jgi:hypothetical protein